MSQTAITTAFEQWKASQTISNESIVLDEFIFALVPGLDPSKPIDRAETVPAAAQIVHRQAVSRTGVVNDNAVVFSVVLGAEVGDFSFNWIGLVNKASNTLAMVVHAPEQHKIRTAAGQQGNVLTRSFLMEFSGAQSETGITTPAETWQIDFTARMAGMDERQRLENSDLYGAAAFFGDGWLVGKTGTQYFVTQGAGYVGGLRAQLAANQNIAVSAKPVKVWLDVCWTGSLTSTWAVQSKITVAANLADYVQNGVQHYVFALASIDASGTITDLRPKGTLEGQKADSTFLVRNNNLADIADKNAALANLHGVPRTTTVNGKALSENVTLSPADIGALAVNGTAVAAKKLETSRKIAGVAFDGTRDISLSVSNIEGLGSAATKDAGTADGNVMPVGAFGLGAVAAAGVSDANAINASGFWRVSSDGIHGPIYASPSEIIHCQYDLNAAHQIGWQAGYADGPVYHRYKKDGVWSAEWVKVYDEKNRPSAAEIGTYTQSEINLLIAARGEKNTASRGTRGWWKCGDTGMLYQWGYEGVNGATVKVFSFPVTFPTGCASIIVSNNIERTDGENSMTGMARSASQYSLSNTAATPRYISWFAIGF